MREPQDPHVRSQAFLGAWFAMSRELEQAAEQRRPPDGQTMFEAMHDACEGGWRQGYSDGLHDGESRRGFSHQFDTAMADLTARDEPSGAVEPDRDGGAA